MAIKCLHTDHSSVDQQGKAQKIQPEEVEGSTAHEGKAEQLDTYDLLHLKHDWFDKGDTIVVHLYVKDVIKENLGIILFEDELQVKFSTSNKQFLQMYSGTSASTLFSWNLKLRGKVDITSSSNRVAKAFLEVSLKKKSPGRWNGLEKPNIPGHTRGSIAGERPFRHLCHNTSSSQESRSKGTVCNGIHSKPANNTDNSMACGDKETTNTILTKSTPGTNVTEEKVIPNGVPVVTQSCEACSPPTLENSCDGCGAFGEENSPEMCESKTSVESQSNSNFDSKLRTKDSGEPVTRHFDLETSTVRTPVENTCTFSSGTCSITSCSQAQKATATSAAESLTTTFSSLSSTVQPSTSTSTMSSVSSFDLTKASESDNAIPLPPPNPPPPPQSSSFRGCGDGQVKTGVMGGSQSDTTHLPFSEAIRAAASKSMGAGKEGFDAFNNSDECVHVGLTGLENLGNTCYLNSIVQCLANTRQLRDFFLADKYKADVNTENPLGTGGKLAIIFANLMRNLWSGRERSLSPYKLKSIVGEKVCQFKGFMQQDAQEFMAFLLDGLHEDLNRIKEKPYVEEVEGAGKPDAEVANEAWRRYKSRNDSVIVDLFQGQLKSKLTCPVCNKISIKYDPFMNLSVPLPKEQKLLPVTIFFKDCRRVPLKIVVKVTQDANVEHLTAAVQRVTAIHPGNMRVHEIFRGKFHRTFHRGCSLSSVVATDIIVVYEVLSEEEAGEEVYEVPIIQRTVCPRVIPAHCASCYGRPPGPGVVLRRCTQCWGIGYCNQDCQKDHWSTHKRSCKRVPQPIGAPFIVSIPASQATFSQLQTMAEEYSKYSVVVRPGVSEDQESPKKGEASFGKTSTATDAATEKDAVSAEGACASGLVKDSSLKFHIKPVNACGDGLLGQDGTRLSAEGPEPLDLAGKYFSIDWRNHPRSAEFVIVEEKDLECEEHSSSKSETIRESYSCSLKECLELFTEPETLSENDAWYCPQCKTHREATKQLSVWRLPEILIIHLKRFSFRSILFKDKITKLVDFPLRGLDMSRFTLGKDDKEGSLYDLFAVANHSGNVNFGHYTAFGRLAEADHTFGGLKSDGQGWRYFDDRNVTETSEERVVSKYAYVLFYRRRHTVDLKQTDAEQVAAQEEMENVEERRKANLEDVDENELD